MEKSFKIDRKLGWIWHKSWNIPNILIRMHVIILYQIRDDVSYETYLCPKNFKVFFIYQARIFTVKEKSDKNNLIFKDVGMNGNTIVDIIDGNAFFIGTTFKTTSFKNQVIFIYFKLNYFIFY